MNSSGIILVLLNLSDEVSGLLLALLNFRECACVVLCYLVNSAYNHYYLLSKLLIFEMSMSI